RSSAERACTDRSAAPIDRLAGGPVHSDDAAGPGGRGEAARSDMSMDLSSAAQAARDSDRLAAGTRLGGGRYTIVKPVRFGLFAGLSEATDATTGNGVSIHLFDPRLAGDRQLVERLGQDARRAAAI